ncbi:MAG: thiamine diphosphokinase [Muribaculaceae bacterium]
MMINPFELSETVIVGNGEFPTATLPLSAIDNAKMIVACDGAAHTLINHGVSPDLVIGDGDSLSSSFRDQLGERFILAENQEFNDLTKSIRYCADNLNVKRVSIVGATGKREDHTIGNISLLIDYMKSGIIAAMFTDYGCFIACAGSAEFRSFPGQQISVFNFTATDFSSNGLVYPLHRLTSWWQGTLNEAISDSFDIYADGDYIVFFSYLSKN